MAPFTNAANKAIPARTIRAVSTVGIFYFFASIGEMGLEELAFNVFIPAAVLLTGLLALFLMIRF
jgi:hypothetical protein